MKRIYRNLDFDDVLIKPIPSQVNSREEVDISVKLSDNFTLQFPLIASPMRGIVDANFASVLSDLGGIAILHRFYNSKDELYSDANLLLQTNKNFGMSIGLNDNDYITILDRYQPKILIVDVANGYTESLLVFCEEVKKYIVSNNLNTLLCSGNVCTLQGVENLKNSGIDIVRFGIGTGQLCSTRVVTGIGNPSVSALQEASQVNDVIICMDGGINSSGNFVKAIVAGADLCLGGSIFGKTFESPNDGSIFGMASRKLNEMMYTRIKSIEGIEKTVKKEYSLEQLVEEFSWGIKSAATYLDARNLFEIWLNGSFIQLK